MSLGFEIAIVLLLVLANGIFALAEIAVVSARKSRLQHMADKGDARARAVLKLKQEPERFLSTVQVGITLIGILAGAYGGAAVTVAVRNRLAQAGLQESFADDVSFFAVVAGITFLSVVVGELVPKQLGLSDAVRWARFVAGPMHFLATVSAPIIWLLSRSGKLILWLLRVRSSSESALSQDEIKVILQEGAQSGALERGEHEMVERVMFLADRRTAAIMTPRTKIAWLDVHASLEENLMAMREAGHTYYPLCDGELDHVLGIVSTKDLWMRLLPGRLATDLRFAMKTPTYVPETMPALKLLETFKQTGQHICMVVDEYGGLRGLVTLHDVMEGIVGDLPGGENIQPSAVRREDGSWLLDGLLPIDELEDLLPLKERMPIERDYQTLAGFLLSCFRRIPRRGESIVWGGYRFEVVDMDGMRIDQVLAAPLSEPAAQEGEVRS